MALPGFVAGVLGVKQTSHFAYFCVGRHLKSRQLDSGTDWWFDHNPHVHWTFFMLHFKPISRWPIKLLTQTNAINLDLVQGRCSGQESVSGPSIAKAWSCIIAADSGFSSCRSDLSALPRLKSWVYTSFMCTKINGYWECKMRVSKHEILRVYWLSIHVLEGEIDVLECLFVCEPHHLYDNM